MTKRDEGVLARNGTPGPALYFHATTPDAPKVAVGLVHGFAEHGARYAHVADAWAERGIATVSIDLRGHGKAEGLRGGLDRFSEYLDDVAELTRLVRARLPDAPTVLFGHSMGGLIAASVAIEHPSPWRALALSGPFFETTDPVPAPKRIAGKIAGRLAPNLGIPVGFGGKDVTHDPVRARAYDEDPLVFKNARAGWFREIQAAQARALSRAPALSMPLLLVHGTADRLASPARARAFFDAAGSADKTWDARDGLFHEVLNEVEWRPVADRFAEWILAHA